MTRKRQNKKSEHYVNNKEFTQQVTDYVNQCKIAEQKGLPRPKMNDYLGECIMRICKRIAVLPNFSGYSYIDEMIYDGIEGCVYGLPKFNREKSDNAFSYASMIVINKFRQRLNKEKYQHKLKQAIFENVNIMFMATDTQDSDDKTYLSQWQEEHQNFSQSQNSTYDEGQVKKKRKPKSPSSKVSSLKEYI